MRTAHRDHPRGCGAHRSRLSSHIELPGSSPRVRGSLVRLLDMVEIRGIIPAGAGLTCAVCLIGSIRRDHPRGCGAHSLVRFTARRHWGSSPRVRGSLCLMTASGIFRGIIPAGAGLTSVSSSIHFLARDHPRGCGAHPEPSSPQLLQAWDHPRGCGAHSYCRLPTQRRAGSSPRVRGSH